MRGKIMPDRDKLAPPWSWLYKIAGCISSVRQIKKESAAIGVIGCADGPTSIFVAKRRRPRPGRCDVTVHTDLGGIIAAVAVTALAMTTIILYFTHRGKD